MQELQDKVLFYSDNGNLGSPFHICIPRKNKMFI